MPRPAAAAAVAAFCGAKEAVHDSALEAVQCCGGFPRPNDVPRAIEALGAVDCEFEYDPDTIDDFGPTVSGTITGTTELDEDEIGDWLMGIIKPFRGLLVEWGFD
jgi:hypothetical protein